MKYVLFSPLFGGGKDKPILTFAYFHMGCFNHQPLSIHPKGPNFFVSAGGWPQQAAKRGVDAGNLGFPVVTLRVIHKFPGAVILRSLPSSAKKRIVLGLPKNTHFLSRKNDFCSIPFKGGILMLVSWRVLLVEDYLSVIRD